MPPPSSGTSRRTPSRTSFEAHLGAVTRFPAKYNFVYRTKTNEATRSPAEVYEEATAFMAGSQSSLQLTREDISGWVTEVVWGL
jgi:hypothetical protein